MAKYSEPLPMVILKAIIVHSGTTSLIIIWRATGENAFVKQKGAIILRVTNATLLPGEMKKYLYCFMPSTNSTDSLKKETCLAKEDDPSQLFTRIEVFNECSNTKQAIPKFGIRYFLPK